MNVSTKRRICHIGIVVGSLLTAAPLFSVLGTIFGMAGAFNTLASSGIKDPAVLSEKIGTVLGFTAAGLFVFPFGVLILVLSIVLRPRGQASVPPLPSQTAN